MFRLNDEFVDYYKIFPHQFDLVVFDLRKIIINNFIQFILKLHSQIYRAAAIDDSE